MSIISRRILVSHAQRKAADVTQDLIERLRCDETPPGSTRSRLRSRCFPKTGRTRRCVHVVAARRRCKIRAHSNGERNSAARIFRSSCSRSLEIASGHYGRLLTNPPPPYRALLCPLSLSLSFSSFLRRLRFSPLLSFPSCLFSLSWPLPVLCLCRFLSVLSRLLYPLLRNQTRGPRWYAAQWRSPRRCRPSLTHV